MPVARPRPPSSPYVRQARAAWRPPPGGPRNGRTGGGVAGGARPTQRSPPRRHRPCPRAHTWEVMPSGMSTSGGDLRRPTAAHDIAARPGVAPPSPCSPGSGTTPACIKGSPTVAERVWWRDERETRSLHRPGSDAFGHSRADQPRLPHQGACPAPRHRTCAFATTRRCRRPVAAAATCLFRGCARRGRPGAGDGPDHRPPHTPLGVPGKTCGPGRCAGTADRDGLRRGSHFCRVYWWTLV